jgi:hypothetical protein
MTASSDPTPANPAIQPVPIKNGAIAIAEDGVDVLLTIVLHLTPDLSLRSVGTFRLVGRARSIDFVAFFAPKRRFRRQNL